MDKVDVTWCYLTKTGENSIWNVVAMLQSVINYFLNNSIKTVEWPPWVTFTPSFVYQLPYSNQHTTTGTLCRRYYHHCSTNKALLCFAWTNAGNAGWLAGWLITLINRTLATMESCSRSWYNRISFSSKRTVASIRSKAQPPVKIPQSSYKFHCLKRDKPFKFGYC